MIERNLVVERNERVAAKIFRMDLTGDIPQLVAGSFVEVSLNGLYLRRPISVCESVPGKVTLVYKVVGKGTNQMAELPKGTVLSCLLELGNGFSYPAGCKKALLIGGGIGTAPLYQLAVELRKRNIGTTLIAGFASESEIFYQKEFEKVCDRVLYATMDGTLGHKGLVTELLDGCAYDYFYACGPTPMLKAVTAAVATDGELSLEERMGCGFGICMGCSLMTNHGPKRVCKDGPVFRKEELVW